MENEKAKLFVGGISRETSEEDLTSHFQKYGPVLYSLVAKEKITKCPRGFGFVQFSDSSAADWALRDSHLILGRSVDVKRAVPRNDSLQSQPLQSHSYLQRNSGLGSCNNEALSGDCYRNKKVFVGGLPANLTEEQFKSYFEKFGRIIDVVVMQDSTTNRPRGFGFITFNSEESVDRVLMNARHDLNGRSVEVKMAVPKDEINASGNNFTPRAGVNKPSNQPSQPMFYSNYGPGYHVPTNYGSIPAYGGYVYGTDAYGRGYPFVGFGRSGFGMNPVAPRGPWNGHMMIGPAMCALPYNNACIYPAYLNDGVTSPCMYNCSVPSLNGNLNQVSCGNGYLPINGPPSSEEVLSLDINALKLNGGDGSS